MKTSFYISITLILLTSSAIGQKRLYEWKKIRVFETTRAEAELFLKRPAKVVGGWHIYEGDSNHISILYADGPCTSPGSLVGGFNVKKDAVLEFIVRPRTRIEARSLAWDLSRFEWLPEKHRAQFGSYLDRTRSVTIVVHYEPSGAQFVESISFGRPRARALKLECPSKNSSILAALSN